MRFQRLTAPEEQRWRRRNRPERYSAKESFCGWSATDQFRPAVGKFVIDLPAGLSGDIKGQEDEGHAVSALRELFEETGFVAETLKHLADCPSSPGLTSEVVSYFLAHQVTRVTEGGGVESEQIRVQTPKLRTIKKWLAEQVAAGKLIDPKVYAGLYFIGANSKK
jgi:ADP-ribose pyrophosphatase